MKTVAVSDRESLGLAGSLWPGKAGGMGSDFPALPGELRSDVSAGKTKGSFAYWVRPLCMLMINKPSYPKAFLRSLLSLLGIGGGLIVVLVVGVLLLALILVHVQIAFWIAVVIGVLLLAGVMASVHLQEQEDAATRPERDAAIAAAVKLQSDRRLSLLSVVIRDRSLTCRSCGVLAAPIIGTTHRYRCLSCGRQFAAARHDIERAADNIAYDDAPEIDRSISSKVYERLPGTKSLYEQALKQLQQPNVA